MVLDKTKHYPIHGGRLHAAAQRYKIPVQDWLDLSTGINPNGWPVPAIPASVFNRLPEDEDDLIEAAGAYFNAKNILPVAGSQAAIQLLPQLRSRCLVGVLSPGYQEHAHHWQRHGHDVKLLNSKNIDGLFDTLNVLVIINPNNPTGEQFTPEQMIGWHQQLAARNGWLIIDEAFMDSDSQNSMIEYSERQGLIVLRSLGKFFGLAGIRVGFVLAQQELLVALAKALGPWNLSHPSRFIATGALQDKNWQKQTRRYLKDQSQKLYQLLQQSRLTPIGSTDLFQWVCHPQAEQIHEQLAQKGILTRHFAQPTSLRFGLPNNEAGLFRLQNALSTITTTSSER